MKLFFVILAAVFVSGSSAQWGNLFGNSLGSNTFRTVRTAQTATPWWETATASTTLVSSPTYTQKSVIASTVDPAAADVFVDPNMVDGEKTVGDTPAEVFNQNKVRKYNIEISSNNLRILNSDISAEKYVPCTLITDYGSATARTYTGVGCRYKGAVGSLLGCLDENTGKLNGKCRKLSFKIDANKFREDNQKIDGMKRLQLHGMAVDRSLVSERLSYNMLRAAGIAAPQATHAEVYVNGYFDGIYMAIQEISTSLTKVEFADDAKKGKGAVYKDYWFRKDQSTEKWLDKHHQSGKKDHGFVIEVYRAIEKASETDCAMIEKYFDTDSIAAITAINDLVGQTDDWRLRHNFFWYVREEWDGTKKMVMVPWDYDRLDDNGGGLDFRRKKQSTWWQSTNFNYNSQECLNPQEDGSVQGWQYATGNRGVILRRKRNALPPDAASPIQCDKITRMLANCVYDKVKQKYNMFRQQFTPARMDVKINAYRNQIKNIVAQDSSITNYEWSAGIRGLKRYLRSAPSYAATRRAIRQPTTTSWGGWGR